MTIIVMSCPNLDGIMFKIMIMLKTIIAFCNCNYVTVTVKKKLHSKNQLGGGSAALKRLVIFH